jgi:hypothetical protein
MGTVRKDAGWLQFFPASPWPTSRYESKERTTTRGPHVALVEAPRHDRTPVLLAYCMAALSMLDGRGLGAPITPSRANCVGSIKNHFPPNDLAFQFYVNVYNSAGVFTNDERPEGRAAWRSRGKQGNGGGGGAGGSSGGGKAGPLSSGVWRWGYAAAVRARGPCAPRDAPDQAPSRGAARLALCARAQKRRAARGAWRRHGEGMPGARCLRRALRGALCAAADRRRSRWQCGWW